AGAFTAEKAKVDALPTANSAQFAQSLGPISTDLQQIRSQNTQAFNSLGSGGGALGQALGKSAVCTAYTPPPPAVAPPAPRPPAPRRARPPPPPPRAPPPPRRPAPPPPPARPPPPPRERRPPRRRWRHPRGRRPPPRRRRRPRPRRSRPHRRRGRGRGRGAGGGDLHSGWGSPPPALSGSRTPSFRETGRCRRDGGVPHPL